VINVSRAPLTLSLSPNGRGEREGRIAKFLFLCYLNNSKIMDFGFLFNQKKCFVRDDWKDNGLPSHIKSP
jgi:hypothetical protein